MRAILVEDDPLDAQIEQITLTQAGFDVVVATSLPEGEAQATQLLSVTTPYTPTVIVIDLRVPHPSHPELEGAVLAAILTRRMQAHTLHSALIVALTNHLNPEREAEALFAGCQHVLMKPLSNTHALWLKGKIAHQPRLEPAADTTGAHWYQKKAEEIMSMVRRGTLPHPWTQHDVRLVLHVLTEYDAPHIDAHDQQATLLLTLGGRQSAEQMLEQCVAYLDPPYDAILATYLRGESRRTVRQQLMDAGYSRTHSYYCINELPARLCHVLQRLAHRQAD